MTGIEGVRVMIADDHPVVCRGLAAIVRAERGIWAVGEGEENWKDG